MTQCEFVNVHGYNEFLQSVADRPGRIIFAYFCGDKDEHGKSWCPDCARAEPVLKGAMDALPQDSVFIYCQVGERSYWKDPSNEFKTELKLTGVPTLLRYGTTKKLVEDQCVKEDLLRMMFTEADD